MARKKKCNKKSVNKLADAVKECNLSGENGHSTQQVRSEVLETVFASENDTTLTSIWPKFKLKVPAIFLHSPNDFSLHIKRLLAMKVKFYNPLIRAKYTIIKCQTFNDHKAMIQYFEKRQMPYHTFGHPNKKKVKVVIRGISRGIEISQIKKELKSVSIPILRVHKMVRPENDKSKTILVLAVVPYNEEGKKLLLIKKLLGCDVKMELAVQKSKQCHLCQMWGHSQRYCHGEAKCVKCAGPHLTIKCTRDPSEGPPKCANCGGEHTASYHKCPFCPDSQEYKLTQNLKIIRMHGAKKKTPLIIITSENCNELYRNVNYRKIQFDGK